MARTDPTQRIRRAAVMLLLLAYLPFRAMAIEEPPHQVVQQLNGAEVRQYAPYVVAEVALQGSAEQTGNDAFRILAAYIFGSNRGVRVLADRLKAWGTYAR